MDNKLLNQTEEYPEYLKAKLGKVETEIEKEAQKKLKETTDIIIAYLMSLDDPYTVNVDDVLGLLSDDNFLIDLSGLEKAIALSSNEQKGYIQNFEGKPNNNITDAFIGGVFLSGALDKKDIKQIVSDRQKELATLLRETTAEKLTDFFKKKVVPENDLETLSKELAQTIGAIGTRATTIGRTEVNNAINEGDRLYFESLGREQYIIVNMPGACDNCVDAAKKIYQMWEKVLPLHANDRCRIRSLPVQSVQKSLSIPAQIETLSKAEQSMKLLESVLSQLSMIQGKDGYTPILGKDYFTLDDRAEIIKAVKELIPNPKDGYTPKAGVDYYTEAEIQSMIDLIESKIKIPVDGKDGKDGKDGITKTIVEYTNVEASKIRDLLKELKGKEKLSIKDLKDFDSEFNRLLSKVQIMLANSGGGGIPDAPADGSIYGRKDNAWEVVGDIAAQWGNIGGTLSNQTDLQDALNLKANVTDLDNYLKLDASNDPLTGTLNIAPTTNSTELILRASAGQTTNTLEIKNSSNTTLSSFNNLGHLAIGTSATPGSRLSFGTYFINSSTPTSSEQTSHVRFYESGAILYGIGVSLNALNIAANQSTGTIRLYTNDVEHLRVSSTGLVGIGTNAPASKLHVQGIADDQVLIVQGNATQTVNLQEWKDSAGVVLSSVNASGYIGVGTNAPDNWLTVKPIFSTSGSHFASRYQPTLNADATVLYSTYNNPIFSGTGTLGNLYGFLSLVNNTSTGTITNAFGFSTGLRNTGVGAIMTNGYGVYIDSASNSGTITTQYGLYIANQSAGATSYAIYTNAGLNRLGDQLSIIGSANRIQSIVRGASGQSTNLVEYQNNSSTFLSGITSAGNFKLANNLYIVGRNQANSADINMWRIGTSNNIQAGTTLDMNSNGLINVSSISNASSTLWSITANGDGRMASLGINSGNANEYRRLDIDALLNNSQGLRVKQGTGTNTVNLVEFINSSSSVLFAVTGAGSTLTTGRRKAVAIKSANYTLVARDEVVVFTATATATLPAATGSGQTYRLVCRAGTLTIDGNASDTIKGSLTQSLVAGEDLIITDTATGIWE